ncbi:hypothetical protein [Lactiplantibacillus fabifermentans]|nr:hypothetical protein [Lactiplantibacillus fabifermentans]
MDCLKKMTKTLMSLVVLFSVMASGVMVGLAATNEQNVIKPSKYFCRKKNLILSNTNDAGIALVNYPSLVSMTADNVVNGRLTKNTKHVTVTFGNDGRIDSAGNIQEDVGRPFKLSEGSHKLEYLRMDITDSRGKSLVLNPSEGLFKAVNNQITLSNQDFLGGLFGGRISDSKKNLNVDLSGIQESLPIDIGFRIKLVGNPTEYGYTLGTFKTDPDMKYNLSIDKQVGTTSQHIFGTASPNGTVSSNVNDVTKDVDQSGKYDLAVGNGLQDFFKTHDTVVLTESNIFGDHTTLKQQQIKLTKSDPKPEFYLDDLDSVHEKNDADIIDMLCKKFKIATTNVPGGADGVTYHSDVTDIANKIEALKDNDTLTLNLHASKAGWFDSAPINIKIISQPGVLGLSMNQTELDFGKFPVPLVRQSIWYPKTWELTVTDNRRKRYGWRLVAQAKVPGPNSRNDLNRFLSYSDGNFAYDLSDQTPVLEDKEEDGVRPAMKTLTLNGQAGEGIFINAGPDMRAETYTGKITWTLEITPNPAA